MSSLRLGSRFSDADLKRRVRFTGSCLVLAALTAGLTACGSSGDVGAFRTGGDGNDGGGIQGGTGGTSAGLPAGELPPEEELEEDFEVPAAVGRFLWAANPNSNRVALVDAQSFEVQALDAGFAPTYLAGLPPSGTFGGGAAVLNQLSQDATFFFLPEDAQDPVTPDSIVVHTVPVHRRANAWRVSASSRFAIAWSNVRNFDEAVDPAEGLQDVTIIDRGGAAPTATRLSVGYRPSQVAIDEAEERAYVVSQPGITVVDLTHAGGPRVERELFLPEHLGEAGRDVSITPDGSLAFVRLEGESEILVVDLQTDARVTVTLPATVTDLDVSADGSRAVAVMRRPSEGAPGEGAAGASGTGPEPSRVAVLPVASIQADPNDFELIEVDGLFGSSVVSEDGAHAILFTNAVPHPLVAIVDLEMLTHRQLDLMAPVQAVFLTNDGSHAVALLSPPAGSVARGAFSLIPVRADFPAKIEGTDAPARFVALSPDSSRALITTRGGAAGPHGVAFARFPGLGVDKISLPSEPLASGIVQDAGKGFVAQRHPEGRLTFVTLEDGASRTLTGFELGGKVVE